MRIRTTHLERILDEIVEIRPGRGLAGPAHGAGGIEQRVTYGRRNRHDGRFTRACRWNVFSIQKHGFDFRNITEARDAIRGKVRIRDAPILELDSFEERAAQPLDDRAHYLIVQAIRIDDRAALEGFDHADDTHLSG